MAKDWDRSAELIHEYSDGLLKGGRLGTLIRWVKHLPEEVIRAKPGLCGDYAWALLLIGELDQAEPYLSHAETFFQEDPQYQGGIASAQAFLARSRGEYQGTIEKSEKALALLPTEDVATRSIVAINLGLTYWHAGNLGQADRALHEALHSGEKSGNHYAAVAARVFIGRNAASRGHLHQAEETYKQILLVDGPPPMLALTHLDLCGLNYEWNRLEVAQDHWQKGMDLSRRSGNVEFQIAAEMLFTRLKLGLGAVEAAEGAALRAFEMSQSFSPFTQARCASSLVQVALTRGDLEGAIGWAERVKVDGDHFTFYMFLNLTRARILMAEGKGSEAAEELSRCYEKASEGGWGYGVIATRVMQCMNAEDPDAAKSFLSDALAMAQSENFLRTFVDHGGGIVPCLRDAVLEGIAAEYVGTILKIVERKVDLPDSSSLVEPLSKREVEVLRLLVAGLSNREMASTLFLSLGTVKSHIHNIYGKLGVRNRAEAIAKAGELELL
jgi:LuxR family maltose regulon positive regulatory protein